MNFAERIDYASLMEPVAIRLLGEPNQNLSKPPRDLIENACPTPFWQRPYPLGLTAQ